MLASNPSSFNLALEANIRLGVITLRNKEKTHIFTTFLIYFILFFFSRILFPSVRPLEYPPSKLPTNQEPSPFSRKNRPSFARQEAAI